MPISTSRQGRGPTNNPRSARIRGQAMPRQRGQNSTARLARPTTLPSSGFANAPGTSRPAKLRPTYTAIQSANASA